jgi:hypothetical protein
MKTQDLRDNDLDSIWTPGPFSVGFGLHLDSTKQLPHSTLWNRTCSSRAVETPPIVLLTSVRKIVSYIGGHHGNRGWDPVAIECGFVQQPAIASCAPFCNSAVATARFVQSPPANIAGARLPAGPNGCGAESEFRILKVPKSPAFP